MTSSSGGELVRGKPQDTYRGSAAGDGVPGGFGFGVGEL